MMQMHSELTTVELCRARSTLRRTVGTLLAGSGLEIRELERELVIRNPHDPDKGRIYVTYANGEVSWKRTLWDYWGYLQGHGRAPEADPDSEPGVDVVKIIGALSGRAVTPP